MTRRWIDWLIMAAILAAIGLVVAAWPVRAQQPLDFGKWISGLRNPVTNVLCCDTADGEFVEWEFKDESYSVYLKGEWRQVPPDAVLSVPNLHGRAIVWWWNDCSPGRECRLKIRCFLPGAGF